MSLPKKSIHVRISDDMHDRLTILAGESHNDLAAHAAFLLEKSIVADFHAITVKVNVYRRLGLTGNERDFEGATK